MTAGDQARDGQANHAFLADDDAMYVFLDPAEELRRTLRLQFWFPRRRHAGKSRADARVSSPGFGGESASLAKRETAGGHDLRRWVTRSAGANSSRPRGCWASRQPHGRSQPAEEMEPRRLRRYPRRRRRLLRRTSSSTSSSRCTRTGPSTTTTVLRHSSASTACRPATRSPTAKA